MNLMSTLEALVLGILQGLTEFLPVSSSGHLRLAGGVWKNMPSSNVVFEIFLHGVTLAVVLVVLRKQILEVIKNRRAMLLVFVCAAVTAGIVLGADLKTHFTSFGIRHVLVTEALTGIFLIIAELVNRRRGDEGRQVLTFKDATVIGVLQAVAVMPGLSRSGLTIGTAFLLGIDRRKAFDFSFLISIPVIGGALLMEFKHMTGAGSAVMSMSTGLAGAAAAAVFGFATLVMLRSWVTKSLLPFAYYCLALSALGSLFVFKILPLPDFLVGLNSGA